ncbi:MAG: Holliday junction branch migration protein RuvA [Flammeovirgaceae bacterium]
MYNYIQGRLAAKDPTFAVIDVNGVGYELKISLNTYGKLQVGETCKLYTYLYVKEDVLSLFGFWEREEKNLYLHLISVSGIGPSTALAILSTLSVQEVKEAIVGGDVKTIQSVKGIGAKTAQRAILELKDKLAKEGVAVSGNTVDAAALTSSSKNQAAALEGLMALGLNKSTAEKTLRNIVKTHGHQLSVEAMIKLALRQ